MIDWTRSPFEPDIARVRRVPGVEKLLADVCELTGMGFAAVSRRTDRSWVMCQLIDRVGTGLEPGSELEIKTVICEEIRQSGRHVVIDHVAGDIDWRTHHAPALYGFQSYISIPIIRLNDGFFGTLCALDPDRSSKPLADVYPHMQVIAEQIALALDTEYSFTPAVSM